MEFAIEFESEEALEEFPDIYDAVNHTIEVDMMEVDEPDWSADNGQRDAWLPEFLEKPGAKNDGANVKTPLEAFRLFFTINLIDNIIRWSNAEGLRRSAHFKHISRDDILKVFGMQILMGVKRYTKESDHWSTRRLLGNKWIKRAMARDRYKL